MAQGKNKIKSKIPAVKNLKTNKKNSAFQKRKSRKEYFTLENLY